MSRAAIAELMARIAAAQRLPLFCMGCGAPAVDLIACPACGSVEGYGPPLADCIGDPPPFGEHDPDAVDWDGEQS